MRILMIAPEPFFQPRGTPISVYFRLKALSDLGHKVDLVTYPLGEDKHFKNVKILRISNFFSFRKIKIGPSLAKIPLDFHLFFKTIRQLTKARYDLIFSHEEAGLFGVVLAKLWRLPHLYDMHSSLPQQLENFNFSRSKILKQIFVWIERFILKNSKSLIVICPDLLNKVKAEGFGNKAVLLENIIDFQQPEISQEEIKKKRAEFASEDQEIVLYAGNFQPYQGVSLLLKAAAQVSDKRVVFLLVGETPKGVEQMKNHARDLRILDKLHFTGQVAPSEVPMYISMADVLVSPRITGTNTPLKIYSFLKSGKPVVATKLWTHTQILDNKIAILVKPEAKSMAEGIKRALFDKKGEKCAKAAKEMADKEYTFQRYREKITEALNRAILACEP